MSPRRGLGRGLGRGLAALAVRLRAFFRARFAAALDGIDGLDDPGSARDCPGGAAVCGARLCAERAKE